MRPTRIVFMGTPEFSVPALTALAAQDELEIILAVTQPDRPKGRGKKLAPSPVKQKAMELGIEVFQPEKLNVPEGIEKLKALAPDYYVVVAFGQILSQEILDIPKNYPINIHASLLPRYRGAAPIQAAVKNMDKETGITTMVMARGMDTGDMLMKARTPVDPLETAQDLHDRLSQIGGDLIVETIKALNEKKIEPEPQDDAKATYVTMLKKADGLIDWTRSDKAVCAHINAMTPWPGAFTQLNGKRIKIFKALPNGLDAGGKEAGDILSWDNEGIHVATGDNKSVTVKELMGNSGKRMEAPAFLRGNPIDLPATFQTP